MTAPQWQFGDHLIPDKITPHCRAGASTRFTSTRRTSTCNMCEYEYKYEYLIIAWVRVRVWVLVDEYEYKYEYRPMIYILYKQQYCIFQSLKRESSHFYNPGTKVQLPIVHVNSLCQYIRSNNFHPLTRIWKLKWTWTNGNNKHKHHNQ